MNYPMWFRKLQCSIVKDHVVVNFGGGAKDLCLRCGVGLCPQGCDIKIDPIIKPELFSFLYSNAFCSHCRKKWSTVQIQKRIDFLESEWRKTWIPGSSQVVADVLLEKLVDTKMWVRGE